MLLLHTTCIVALAVTPCLGSLLPRLNEPHGIHEKRGDEAHGWVKRGRANGGQMEMRIGLTQRNLHRGPEMLREVADPTSAKYGKHLTKQEVAELFAPSADSLSAIKSWLQRAGISDPRVSRMYNGWLKFNATVDEAEALLQTEYHIYQHEESGEVHLGCDSYSVPLAVRDHVDLITPTVHLNAANSLQKLHKREHLRKRQHPVPPAPGDLSNCSNALSIDCMRALYEIPVDPVIQPNSSFGVAAFSYQPFNQTDLNTFFSVYNTALVDKPPILVPIDGGDDSGGEDGETNLDLEVSMSLVYPLNVTLYQVNNGGSQDTFLDALDGSYCTYDGGDEYPDRNFTNKDCGDKPITNVISISYAYPEYIYAPAYEIRQCHEYMKLGLMGVTLLSASGDAGVQSHYGDPNVGCSSSVNSSAVFNTMFPATCPYVTAVGATQIPINGTVKDTEIAANWTGGLISGGGFSNVFTTPDYQKDDVDYWFANYKPDYNPYSWNSTGNARGYPDISANGCYYVLVWGGNWQFSGGTSGTTPLVASIITLINNERLAAGKSTVGFINPVLYSHPEILNDVTYGDNRGCYTQGFSCEVGWDPVTGQGTPNYPRMRDYWLSLP